MTDKNYIRFIGAIISAVLAGMGFLIYALSSGQVGRMIGGALIGLAAGVAISWIGFPLIHRRWQ